MAKPVEQTDGIPIYCAHDAMVATSVLEGNPRNPNRHPDDQIRLLAKIIVTQGWRAPITVSKRSGQIVRGHGRLLAAQAAGLTFCPVDYQDYESDEAEYADLVADNRLAELAELDRPTLKDLLQDLDTGALDMELTGFTEDALAGLMEQVHPLELDAGEPRTTLAERFIVPPFSVLDARQGYWQERKRAWIALGIQSEVGRGDCITWTGDAVTEPGLNYYRNRVAPGGSLRPAASLGADGKTRRGDGKGRTLGAIPPNQATSKSPDYEKRGNGLLGESEQARTKYAATSNSSQERLTALQKTGSSAVVYGTAGNASEQSGTSIFDPVLCEIAYRWFCPAGGMVLDPFAGGSVRGIVAAKLGRQYIGIDLRPEQIAANEVQAEAILSKPASYSDTVEVVVSGKWARHLFACGLEYITHTCGGRCCEGSERILVSLLPDEAERQAAAGFSVQDGLLQPDPATGKCPHKQADGLCGVHGTDMKPFGCIASPFTLNAGGTLIIRNRYSLMKCHGHGQPAYRAFRASLDLLFGETEASRVCELLEAGVENVPATMSRRVFDAVHYLDGLKHGAARVHEPGTVKWVIGDSRNVKALAAGEYDMVFSCPPYFDLERYSEDEADLSNTGDYAAFMAAYRQIIADSVGMLRADRFACFVVGDIRDKRGFYRNFVADTIQAFEDAGAKLYNDAVLVTAVGSLPIRVGKQFVAGRKLGKTHQNVLVFYKGDPKKVFALDEQITDEDWRGMITETDPGPRAVI